MVFLGTTTILRSLVRNVQLILVQSILVGVVAIVPFQHHLCTVEWLLERTTRTLAEATTSSAFIPLQYMEKWTKQPTQSQQSFIVWSTRLAGKVCGECGDCMMMICPAQCVNLQAVYQSTCSLVILRARLDGVQSTVAT